MASKSDLPEKVIPLINEVARVEKIVTREKVSVRTVVEIERQHLEANLISSSVSVERVSINRELDHAPAIRTEGLVTIIPVVEERLVVAKKLYLVEEIRITKDVSVEKIDLPVDLRKQKVLLERSTDDQREPQNE